MEKKSTLKKKPRKLELSRETLQPLTSPDTQKVVGGEEGLICTACMSPRCPTLDGDAC